MSCVSWITLLYNVGRRTYDALMHPGGLGAAIGSKLHSQGAKLALLNAPHEAGRLGYLLKKGYNLAEPTEDIRVYECDVTKEESVQASFEEIKLKQVSDSAEPTILVNSSGYISLAPLETMPIDEIQKNIDVNLLGPILLSRSFFHLYMTRKQATGQTLPGRIVSLASQAALIGIKDHAAYCSAKSGLLGLHKCMALDWGPHGITANTISPGVIMTEMGQKAWANEEARDA